jgi:hypothetical protein
MRQQGVPMPDPVVTNGDGIRFPGLNKDAVSQEVAERAQQACDRFRPVLSPEAEAEKVAAARLFSRCMREQGLADFPDPDASGRVHDIPESLRDDPRYEAARTTCNERVRSAPPSR